MSEAERIAIVELADDLQVRKQRIFKVLSRVGQPRVTIFGTAGWVLTQRGQEVIARGKIGSGD